MLLCTHDVKRITARIIGTSLFIICKFNVFLFNLRNLFDSDTFVSFMGRDGFTLPVRLWFSNGVFKHHIVHFLNLLGHITMNDGVEFGGIVLIGTGIVSP